MAVEQLATIGSHSHPDGIGHITGSRYGLWQIFLFILTPKNPYGFLDSWQAKTDVFTILFTIGTAKAGFQIRDRDRRQRFFRQIAIYSAGKNIQQLANADIRQNAGSHGYSKSRFAADRR